MSGERTRKPLRWKQEPRQKGLAGRCQGERGYDLWRGTERLASVRPLHQSLSRIRIGYYWHGAVGQFRRNTCDAHPYPTPESAKDDAEKWVRLSEGLTAPGDAATGGGEELASGDPGAGGDECDGRR